MDNVGNVYMVWYTCIPHHVHITYTLDYK